MSKEDSVFHALADDSRRRIVVLLAGERMNVNAIAGKFKISRPAISKHLRILESSNLVKQVKEGRERYYSFNPKQLDVVFNWLKFYNKFWDKKLAALKSFVEKS